MQDQMDAAISYDPVLLAASVLIAIAAASVASVWAFLGFIGRRRCLIAS